MATQNEPNSPKLIPSADPNEITWQDVKEMGLDPAPAGLTEDAESTQS